MRFTERAEEQREDMMEIVKDMLKGSDIQNRREISSRILDHFVNISPPGVGVVSPINQLLAK